MLIQVNKVQFNTFLIDKELRYKKIEEDNIRLKSFLDKQLTETANLKLETQRTVDILREELDILLKVFTYIKQQELITFRSRESQDKYETTTSLRRNKNIEEKDNLENNNRTAKHKKIIPKLKL